jgi:hypothetical protein
MMIRLGLFRFCFLLHVFLSTCQTAAFLAWPIATPSISGKSLHISKSGPLFANKFLEQKPGESDMQFFKRIQSAASDAATFERMVLGQADGDKKEAETATDDKSSNKNNNKTGYQRVEDWEAEIKERQKKGEFTWEERVQFEGQKYGNGVNQNEILKKNLKAF